MQRYVQRQFGVPSDGEVSSEEVAEFVRAMLGKSGGNASSWASEAYAKPRGGPSRRPPLVGKDDPECLLRLRKLGVEIADLQERWKRDLEDLRVREAEWDSAKHPRDGVPPNPGWWANTGGGSGSAGGQSSPSFLDAFIKRNKTIADLTGGPSTAMIRSSRLAANLQSAGRLPAESLAPPPRDSAPVRRLS